MKKRIKSGNFKVAIVGLGYVGLPLAVEFAKNGITALGFEINEKKVKTLKKGKTYIPDVVSKEIKDAVSKGKFLPTAGFAGLGGCDAVIICVPTPLRKSRDPDISFIINAAGTVAKRLKKGMVVILESTTYPGTTREVVKPILEKSGLKAGKDFFLSFSPERVDPGNKVYKIRNTPKVVGGINKASTELSALVYSKIAEKVIPVSSAETAETVKLLENTFRAVNIAMINEFALMADKLNLDVWEIVEAAASKPFGFMPFQPGPGIGGHCIPLDPHYLAWKMKTLNFEPRFIELAGAINSAMPEHIVRRIADILNEGGKPLSSSKILVIGMAYKPDITDDRESPARDIFALLLRKGAKVNYHDPYVKKTGIEGRIHKSAALTPSEIGKYDCVAIITPHSSLDYGKILKNSKRIFDARNALKVENSKVFRL